MSPHIAEAIRHAIDASLHSPCRSKRGAVVIVNGRRVAWGSWGYNRMPSNQIKCDQSDRCKEECGKTAIHAEQMALMAAGPMHLDDANELVHVKTIDGVPVYSGGPSCLECSKLMLWAGIKAVYLLHRTEPNRQDAETIGTLENGLYVCRYEIMRFHELTAVFNGKSILKADGTLVA